MHNRIVVADSIYDNVSEEQQKKLFNLGFLEMDLSKTKNKKDALRDRVAYLSQKGEFKPEEWCFVGLEYSNEKASCICGNAGIKNRYYLINKHTDAMITVGGSCLEEYFLMKHKKEEMDFSRTAHEPYVWLGCKYDAFIFSILGFKKSYCYFQNRHDHKSVPVKHNMALKAAMAKTLYTFNAPKWQHQLNRGARLHKYLLDIKKYGRTVMERRREKQKVNMTENGLYQCVQKGEDRPTLTRAPSNAIKKCSYEEIMELEARLRELAKHHAQNSKLRIVKKHYEK